MLTQPSRLPASAFIPRLSPPLICHISLVCPDPCECHVAFIAFVDIRMSRHVRVAVVSLNPPPVATLLYHDPPVLQDAGDASVEDEVDVEGVRSPHSSP